MFRAHIPVHGSIPAYDAHEASRAYSAMDPQAALWVWATLVEGILHGRREVMSDGGPERRERMYQESKRFGLFFNVRPALIPETLEDFEAYFRDTVDHGLEVTPAGKKVAESLVSGARLPLTFFGWFFRALAVEGLPATTRDAFGWSSTSLSRSVYGSIRSVARLYYAIVPRVLEVSPIGWYPAVRRRLGGPGRPLDGSADAAPAES